MPDATPLFLCGPLRAPRQMLAEQQYGGHGSIHDDEVAAKLGFRAGPIEGPTHFSQFVPLLQQAWGRAWFERGCFSAHFQNMVVEGEQVRAFVELPRAGAARLQAWAEKADGTPVLEASASLAEDPGPTLLDERLARQRPPERLVILADLHLGMTGAAHERVRMDRGTHLGALYPFTLADKLSRLTEPSSWYDDDNASPWGRAVIPLEMVSVLAEHTAAQAAFPVKGPAVGLFADLEIRMLDGPLFVGEDYLLRREVVALSETRRTESYWVRTRIFDADGCRERARMLLNHAVMKDSYAGYPR
ncbi:MAG: hypothetical protein QM750_27375 [Rubrivivax sp.]